MIVEKAYGDYTDFRIPGIVATESGALLRYCECRKSQGDWSKIDIKVSRSTDEGKTWCEVLLVRGDGATMNNPVMFALRDRLVLLYCKNYKEVYKRVSLDGGEHFGDAERVCFDTSFPYTVVAIGPGHGISHGGRLIAPVWFAFDECDPKAHRPSFVSTFYSDDGGENWQVGELIYPSELCNPSESALAVTKEGEVLISIRHEGERKMRALAKSADGIASWYGLRFEENLIDPTCMGSMTHKDGTVYHVNCASNAERRNLTVKISRDGFSSCKEIKISNEGGYADIALLNDKLFVLYEKVIVKGPSLWDWEPICLHLDTIDLI